MPHHVLFCVMTWFGVAVMSDSDDDIPTLSAETMAALQEFYNDNISKNTPAPSSSMFAVGAVEEDWVREGELCVRRVNTN